MTDNETKIVKAEKKEDSGKDAGASKVQIKQVDIAILQAQREKAAKEKALKAAKAAKQAETKKTQKTMPQGTAMKKTPAGAGKGMAVAGLVCGIIGLVVGASTLLCIGCLGCAAQGTATGLIPYMNS